MNFIFLSLNSLLLDILSLGAILSSILVITARNPVIAVIFLISVFINAAGYLLITGVSFVGITYIIVYIGAITVLFLFIIMMINIRLVDLLEFGREYTKNFPLAILIGALFLYEIINILPYVYENLTIGNYNKLNAYINEFGYIFLNFLPSDIYVWVYSNLASELAVAFDNYLSNASLENANLLLTNFLQIEILGQSLYTYGAMWLLISSIILLLSMISALYLSNI